MIILTLFMQERFGITLFQRKDLFRQRLLKGGIETCCLTLKKIKEQFVEKFQVESLFQELSDEDRILYSEEICDYLSRMS